MHKMEFLQHFYVYSHLIRSLRGLLNGSAEVVFHGFSMAFLHAKNNRM